VVRVTLAGPGAGTHGVGCEAASGWVAARISNVGYGTEGK